MNEPSQEPSPVPDAGREPVVDFAVLGRRLRRTALVLAVLVLVGWVASIPFRGVDGSLLMNLVGLALAAMFVAEVVIVGGSAVRGLLLAGARGDRLASDGVGLLPPQLAGRVDRGRVNRGEGPRRTT